MKQMLKARHEHRLRDVHLRPVLRHRRHHDPARRDRLQRSAVCSIAGRARRRGRPPQPLKNAGVQLYQNKPGTGVRKVHHKLMVIDERLVIAGSFNYTAPGAPRSTTRTSSCIGDLEETDPEAEAANGSSPAYALAEIDRIINLLAEPV